MSTTVMREKRQTTLPQEVADAAGLRPGDPVQWTFEGGEIRGRKLVPAARGSRLKLAKRGGFLLVEGEFSRKDILAAIRADRDGKW